MMSEEIERSVETLQKKQPGERPIRQAEQPGQYAEQQGGVSELQGQGPEQQGQGPEQQGQKSELQGQWPEQQGQGPEQQGQKSELPEKSLVKENRLIYLKAAWFLTGLYLVAVLLIRVCRLSLPENPTGCLFRTLTHLYCPGCGGTRAVLALLRGYPLVSLYYHPIVLYTAAIYGIYMVTNSIEYFSKGCLKIGIHYHIWFAWVALGIIVGNCLLRNILLIFYRIPIR